jgi:hypothetical protein
LASWLKRGSVIRNESSMNQGLMNVTKCLDLRKPAELQLVQDVIRILNRNKEGISEGKINELKIYSEDKNI